MGKSGRIKKAVKGLLLLALLWLIHSFGRVVFHESSQSHQEFVPANADLVFTVKTRMLFEKCLEDVLLSSRDESVYHLLINEWENRQENKLIKESGIDFTADLVIYTIREESHPLTGILFNLSNPDAFLKSMPDQLSREFEAVAVSGQTGLLLRQYDLHFSPKELQKLGIKLLNETQHLSATQLAGKHPNSIAQMLIRSEASEQPSYSNLQLDLRLSDDRLDFEGTAELSALFAKKHPPIKRLPPEGLHLTATLLPPDLFIPSDLGLPETLPQPTAISINLRGSELVEDTDFGIVPDADAMLHFEEPIVLKTILDSLARKQLITQVHEDRFHYLGRLFQYQQLDDHTIYIGRNALPALQQAETGKILVLSGNPSALMRVDGKGMIRGILELMAAYTAGRDFADQTSGIEMTITDAGNNTAKISGSLTFREGHFVTVEFIRLLLGGHLI